VVLVVDGRDGLLPDDRAISAKLRTTGKRVIVAVNKTEAGEEGSPEFSRLGFDVQLPISAEHGIGVGDLLDAALEAVPRVEAPEEKAGELRIALVGRPNVGKSSILNRVLGRERAVVSAIPGTTRDAVDSALTRGGKRYLFVDTAGIRRVRLLKEHVDHVSVVQARHSLERGDVAILVLDAREGLREMDATIGGYVQEARRGAVIAVNKWDLAREQGLTEKKFTTAVRDHLKFLGHAPLVFLSARSGKGIQALFAAVDRVAQACRRRITTGQLNRVLARAAQRYAPKAAKGNQPVRILYGTQVGIAPPTFVLSLNHPVDLHFSYKRYLENQLRAEFDFEGAPIVLKVRTRRH
jgi:GTP-binding protein